MSDYQVKKGEENHVHLEIQRKEFDTKTGNPLFKPYNHVVTLRGFEQFLNHPAGMSINKIHHLPKGAEIPKMKIKDGKKVKEVDYPLIKELSENGGLIDENDDKVARRKELNRLKVSPDLDAILNELELPIEGNKTEKINSILAAEFPKEEIED